MHCSWLDYSFIQQVFIELFASSQDTAMTSAPFVEATEEWKETPQYTLCETVVSALEERESWVRGLGSAVVSLRKCCAKKEPRWGPKAAECLLNLISSKEASVRQRDPSDKLDGSQVVTLLSGYCRKAHPTPGADLHNIAEARLDSSWFPFSAPAPTNL